MNHLNIECVQEGMFNQRVNFENTNEGENFIRHKLQYNFDRIIASLAGKEFFLNCL